MKPFLFLLAIVFATSGLAQDKVKWDVKYNASLKQVEFRAQIGEGWHLYSQHIKNDIGPVPTNFVFTEDSSVKWEGLVTEPKPIQEYDPNFEASLDFFKNEVVFTRKLMPDSKGVVKGYVTYMVCNDMQCLPPVDYEFTVTIP